MRTPLGARRITAVLPERTAEELLSMLVNSIALRGSLRPCDGPHKMTDPYRFAGGVRHHCAICLAWEPMDSPALFPE